MIKIIINGKRNKGKIIEEFQIHGANVLESEDPDVLYVHDSPNNLVDYVDGILSYELIEA